MTFWIDKDHDIRLAIWLSDNDTASFQITRNNRLIKDTSPEINPNSDTIDYPPDDLPF
jgi:hypothetical protein